MKSTIAMIWRWPISFRTAFKTAFKTGLLLSVSFVQGASVSGNIGFTGTHRPNRSDENESPVVVWLEPAAAHPGGNSVLHTRMVQRNKRFSPHVLPIQIGTTVDFPNLDPIFHNAFSSFDGQVFDIGLYSPGSTKSVSFRRKGIVRIFCNIHSTMSAVIVVLDTPYFVTPDATGRFVVPNVPPGEYTLDLFDERATPETLAGLSRPVTVPASGINLGAIQISEAGYLPVAHKNKYGMDYPPAHDEYLVEP
jgi:plastocyanin